MNDTFHHGPAVQSGAALVQTAGHPAAEQAPDGPAAQRATADSDTARRIPPLSSADRPSWTTEATAWAIDVLSHLGFQSMPLTAFRSAA